MVLTITGHKDFHLFETRSAPPLDEMPCFQESLYDPFGLTWLICERVFIFPESAARYLIDEPNEATILQVLHCPAHSTVTLVKYLIKTTVSLYINMSLKIIHGVYFRCLQRFESFVTFSLHMCLCLIILVL